MHLRMHCIIFRKISSPIKQYSMKFPMCIILFLFCYASLSQQPFDEQINASRFEIIKNTIEFLATDAGTFKHVQTTSCQGCKTYADIENFIKANDITGAGALVSEWKKAPLDLTPARGKKDLKRFAASVISRITSGQEKMKRRQLPAFDAYEKKLSTIVASVDDYDETPDNTDATLTEGEVDKNRDVAQETARSANPSVPLVGTAKAAEQPLSSMLSYPGYIAAGLFALLALYFYMQLKNFKQKNASLERTMKDLAVSQGASERKSHALQSRIDELEETLQQSRSQYGILQETLKKEKDKNKRLPVDNHSAVKEENVKPAAPALPAKPAPLIRFARYADQEDGFSTSTLLERNDSETIFEITILTPTSATYKVADNEKAQRYALTNVSYFLSNTCWYDSFPKLNDLIQTDESGALKLEGNKWQITHPAKISFI